MELTTSEREAMTKVLATEYRRASTKRNGGILGQTCDATDWHRSHARKAIGLALTIKVARLRTPRPPLYGDEEVIDALRFCWAIQGTP